MNNLPSTSTSNNNNHINIAPSTTSIPIRHHSLPIHSRSTAPVRRNLEAAFSASTRPSHPPTTNFSTFTLPSASSATSTETSSSSSSTSYPHRSFSVPTLLSICDYCNRAVNNTHGCPKRWMSKRRRIEKEQEQLQAERIAMSNQPSSTPIINSQHDIIYDSSSHSASPAPSCSYHHAYHISHRKADTTMLASQRRSISHYVMHIGNAENSSSSPSTAGLEASRE